MKPNQEGKSTGAIIGAIVVIIILLVGGVLLSQKENVNQADDALVENIDMLPTESEVANETATNEAALSTSTEVVDIEADLDAAADLSQLDAELQALEAELNQ